MHIEILDLSSIFMLRIITFLEQRHKYLARHRSYGHVDL